MCVFCCSCYVCALFLPITLPIFTALRCTYNTCTHAHTHAHAWTHARTLARKHGRTDALSLFNTHRRTYTHAYFLPALCDFVRFCNHASSYILLGMHAQQWLSVCVCLCLLRNFSASSNKSARSDTNRLQFLSKT